MRAENRQQNFDEYELGGGNPGSPEIIQELLDTHSEWTNIQDIVKMTFKGIYQALKV